MADAANPVKTPMTWEEFLAAGEEWQRWELVDGEVEFMSPAGTRHGKVISNLDIELGTYCKVRREWIAFGADTAFTLAAGTWRCPDAALVRAERFPDRTLSEGPADFPPDVAFEVLSPGDTARRVSRKRRQYQESGVIQVWIDPEKRTAEVAYPDRASQYFDEERPLTIDGVDGLTLDLKALFEV
jgi:Uma2 family endonuclease